MARKVRKRLHKVVAHHVAKHGPHVVKVAMAAFAVEVAWHMFAKVTVTMGMRML